MLYFTWKLDIVSNILLIIDFKFDLFENFGISKTFNLKLEQLICKKVLKVVLLDNYFPDLFSNVQIWYWKPFKFGEGAFFKEIK